MSLREYHYKRDFKTTREPKGELSRKKDHSLQFVIQKHHASHLHYDFRLEFDGVLKSWAVPKGPSTNPTDKRLAMEVEDHPLDYAKFEGTIPEGEYGAGEVEIWDHGFWKPSDPKSSVRTALKAGSLKFELSGEKLSGRWALVRMKKAETKNAWLLIKERDPKTPELKPSSSKLPGHTRALTHESKIYYPEAKISKRDLADYYEKAANKILRHLSGRPLMILRCPDGRDAEGFFQKNWNKTLPSAVKKIQFKKSGEKSSLLMVDSEEGLFGLAQMGVLELHTWNTHANHIEHPDQFVFDIDPHEHVSWENIVETAHVIRDELKRYGMKSFLKTTGGKGLHVVAPVAPTLSWDLGKKFCQAICEDIASRAPSLYLTTMTKSKRTGRIFLDYLRNGRGATAIAPYSPRARLDAPIAVPISWLELGKGVRSDSIHLTDIGKRLNDSYKDPWADFYKIKQSPKKI